MFEKLKKMVMLYRRYRLAVLPLVGVFLVQWINPIYLIPLMQRQDDADIADANFLANVTKDYHVGSVLFNERAFDSFSERIVMATK